MSERVRKRRDSGAEAPTFVDMPNGIFTASGVWFHVREADLQEWAGPVLESRPVERLRIEPMRPAPESAGK